MLSCRRVGVLCSGKAMLSCRRPMQGGAPPRRQEPPKSPRTYEEVREAAQGRAAGLAGSPLGLKPREEPTKPLNAPRKK